MRQLPLTLLVQQHNHRPWFPPFDETRWRFFADNAGNVPIREVAARAALIAAADLRPVLAANQQPLLLISSVGEGLVADACRSFTGRSHSANHSNP